MRLDGIAASAIQRSRRAVVMTSECSICTLAAGGIGAGVAGAAVRAPRRLLRPAAIAVMGVGVGGAGSLGAGSNGVSSIGAGLDTDCQMMTAQPTIMPMNTA